MTTYSLSLQQNPMFTHPVTIALPRPQDRTREGRITGADCDMAIRAGMRNWQCQRTRAEVILTDNATGRITATATVHLAGTYAEFLATT